MIIVGWPRTPWRTVAALDAADSPGMRHLVLLGALRSRLGFSWPDADRLALGNNASWRDVVW